jgi:hypothetical protein
MCRSALSSAPRDPTFGVVLWRVPDRHFGDALRPPRLARSGARSGTPWSSSSAPRAVDMFVAAVTGTDSRQIVDGRGCWRRTADGNGPLRALPVIRDAGELVGGSRCDFSTGGSRQRKPHTGCRVG